MRSLLLCLLLAVAGNHAHAQDAGSPRVADPAGSAEAQARARFEAGRSLVESGAFVAARAEFQRGFEYSGRPLFLFNMAECARHLGDAEAARREYSEYLRMEPEGGFASIATSRLSELGPGDTRTPDFVIGLRTQARAQDHLERGIDAYNSAHFPEALDAFERAYRITEDPKLLFHIGQARRQLGHSEEALEYYERFLDEALPGAEHRREAEMQRDELVVERDTTEAAPVPGRSSEFGMRGGAIVSLGVSAGALLSMLVSGPMTLRLRSTLNEQGCAAGGCAAADVDSLVRRARTFDVSAAVSLAAFTTGLVLLLLAPEQESTGARLSPTLGNRQVGLDLQGAF